MDNNDIIISPVVSEKTTDMAEDGKYVFRVANKSNKHMIDKAIREKDLGAIKLALAYTVGPPEMIQESKNKDAAKKEAKKMFSQLDKETKKLIRDSMLKKKKDKVIDVEIEEEEKKGD